MSLRLTKILLSYLLICISVAFAEEEKVKNTLSDPVYLKQFQEVFERIDRDYVQEPEKQKMTDEAINGMLNSLDPHSSYFTDDDLEDFLNQTKGEFGGIGVEVMYENGAIKIISPIDDLPAYNAGIRAGDYIVGVNDEFVSTLGFNKSIKLMRGEPGTKVKLLVINDEASAPKTIELVRELVTIKPVKSQLEKNDIAYIRISTFNEHTILELKKSMKTLQQESKDNLKGIILDLRNNGGGLLDQAVAVSEYFIDSGVIVSTKGRTNNSNAIFTSNKYSEKAPNVPIIVLINSGSASASEIVAGALKDHKRGIILGTKSFGKGSVQSFTQISPRAAVKLTTAKYYTPNDHSIQAEGIEPDVVIEMAKVEYPEKKGVEKRFSESSLRNYLKNENDTTPKNDSIAEKVTKNKDVGTTSKEKNQVKNQEATNVKSTEKDKSKDKDNKDKSKDKDNIKDVDQLSDRYKQDFQYARAFDLMTALILINTKDSEVKK